MKWLLAYISASVVMQLLFGNVDVSFFSFPIDLVLGVAGVALLLVFEREWGSKKFMIEFRSARMAYILLALVACACVAGGLIPAFAQFTTSVPFVALLVALLAHLTLVLINRLRRFSFRRDGAFVSVHLGILIALYGGMAGSADTRQMNVLLGCGEDVSTAYDAKGCTYPLGYTLRMLKFEIERSEADNSPVQYRATLLVDGKPCELAVNSPYAKSFGEDIYLMNYHLNNQGSDVACCVVQIVREPWKYVMLAGIVLLLVGVMWSLKTVAVEGKV
ncbi:MAG: cytochrome c biogenesis protein ResB [Muribaculaceae bacterium]